MKTISFTTHQKTIRSNPTDMIDLLGDSEKANAIISSLKDDRPIVEVFLDDESFILSSNV